MALTRCSMQSCGILLSSAGKMRTSLITGFNKHESRLLYAVLFCCFWDPLSSAVSVGAQYRRVLWTEEISWLVESRTLMRISFLGVFVQPSLMQLLWSLEPAPRGRKAELAQYVCRERDGLVVAYASAVTSAELVLMWSYRFNENRGAVAYFPRLSCKLYVLWNTVSSILNLQDWNPGYERFKANASSLPINSQAKLLPFGGCNRFFLVSIEGVGFYLFTSLVLEMGASILPYLDWSSSY